MNAGEFAKRRAMIERDNARSRTYRRKAMASLLRESQAKAVIVEGKVVAWKLPNGQTVCKKRRYPQEEDAKLALLAVQEDPRTMKVPRRYYHCQYCRGWHLTSQVEDR